MYADEGNLEQILWNICLKCFFFANIASNLKVESMHFAHRNCEYILGVYIFCVFPFGFGLITRSIPIILNLFPLR